MLSINILSDVYTSNRFRKYSKTFYFSLYRNFFIIFSFALLLILFFGLSAKKAWAEETRISVDYLNPTQLIEANSYKVEARGRSLDQIERAILIQSLPYLKSTLLKSSGQIGAVTALDFKDHYVYAITDYSQISIIDISDPNYPQVKGEIKKEKFLNSLSNIQPLSFHDLRIVDNYLFITDPPFNGLWVVDISNRLSPVIISLLREPSVYAVYIEAGKSLSGTKVYTIYLTTWQYGLRIYSWEGGNQFVFQSGMAGGLTTPYNLEVKIQPSTQSNYIYIANGYSANIFRKIGKSIEFIYSIESDFFEDPNLPPYYPNISDVKVKDEYLYMVDSQYGLYVVDINLPEQPRLLNRFPLASGRKSITIYNDLAFLAGGEYGLDVLDISLPPAPAFVHHVSTEGNVNLLRVKTDSGQYALVANGYAGFAVLDIKSLTLPIMAGHLNVKGDIWNINVATDHAYISTGELGLKVVKLSDSLSSTLTYNISNTDINNTYLRASDCCLYKNALYLVNDSNLCTFSYSADWELNPFLLSTIPRSDIIQSIVVNNNYLYMLKLMQGLEIFQIGSSLIPSSCGSISLSSGFTPHQELWIANNVAYIANGPAGLWMVNISNPKSPQTISQKSFFFPIEDIRTKDNYAYLINGNYGSTSVSYDLCIADISDQKNPVIVGGLELKNDNLEDCSLWQDFLYIAGINHGVWMIDVSTPSRPVILDNLTVSRGARAVLGTQEQIYIGERYDMFNIYSAPRSLTLFDPQDPNHVLDPADPYRDPNILLFSISGGLSAGLYDLIFLKSDGEKIRTRQAIQIEKNPALDLKAGLNLFGYPGKIPLSLVNSSDLIKAINPAKEVFHSLSQINPVQKSWGDSGGDIFNIEEKRGYLLYLQEDRGSVNLRAPYYFPLSAIIYQLGRDLDYTIPVHWISFPIKEDQVLALGVIEKLKGLSGWNKNRVEMKRFESVSGKWKSVYDFYDQASGQNFTIKRGEGYILSRQHI